MQVYIRFTPDSLADYDDLFVVDTATSRFSIPLKARRPPPMLTLSPELHCGEVVCGNRLVSGRAQALECAPWLRCGLFFRCTHVPTLGIAVIVLKG